MKFNYLWNKWIINIYIIINNFYKKSTISIFCLITNSNKWLLASSIIFSSFINISYGRNLFNNLIWKFV